MITKLVFCNQKYQILTAKISIIKVTLQFLVIKFNTIKIRFGDHCRNMAYTKSASIRNRSESDAMLQEMLFI